MAATASALTRHSLLVIRHACFRMTVGLAAHLVTAGAGFCQSADTSASAKAPVQYELLCAGSDDLVYFVMSEWKPHERGTYDTWLAYVDKSSSDIRAVPGPLAETLRPRRVALAGSNLHIFYADGTHYRYTSRLSRRELRLPDPVQREVVPEAVAGEAVDREFRVWAVVNAITADGVAAEYEKVMRSRATQPASETQPEIPSLATISTRPESGYHIVSYNGQFWRPEFAAPAAADAAAQLWLDAGGGRVHLLWQKTREDAEIQYARHEGGAWVIGSPIMLPSRDSLAAGFPGIGNRRLVFVAMMSRSAAKWQPIVYMKPEYEGDWTPTSPLLSDDAQPLLLPGGSASGVFSDLIAMLRPASENAEVALWRDSGGKPEQAFTQAPRGRSVLDPSQRSQRDLRIALALGILLLLIFWRRHATFAAPVALPPGYALAGTGRRAVAALLDLAPAAGFVAWWWAEPLQATLNELAVTGDQAQFEAAWADAIFWPSIIFRLIYMGYCLAFELIGARSPGKWLLGCTVLAESGSRPTWIQSVVRNATRLIEFQPDPPIFLPLLLLVFVTRNRQRVGDLLARTIVVETAPILETPGDEDPG